MPCKTNPSEAQEYFERIFGQRPSDMFADEIVLKEICDWEYKRAEFFSYMMIHDDCDIAGRAASIFI